MSVYSYKSRFAYYIAIVLTVIVIALSFSVLREEVYPAGDFYGWYLRDGVFARHVLHVLAFFAPFLSLCASILLYCYRHYIAASLILFFILVAPIGYYVEISVIAVLFALIAAIGYFFELRKHPANSNG